MTDLGKTSKLEQQKEIIKLDNLVRIYLVKNPPTLGHGYSHFKKVARNSYRLALKNSFSGAKIAYVVGLLHDLYRPAFGQAGQEEHEEKTVKEVDRLLEKTSFTENIKKEVKNAILNHDEIIQQGEASLLMEIYRLLINQI